MHSEQPDIYGHKMGPLSLSNPLRMIDRIVGQLMNGLKQMKLHRCVNIILVGDHGTDCTQPYIFRQTFCSQMKELRKQHNIFRICTHWITFALTLKRFLSIYLDFEYMSQHFKPYLKQHLPKRLHYANNRRIEDIHLLVDRKWKAPEMKRHCGFHGDHGYDNKINSMQTIFMGYGPTFKFRTKVPVFENIELYNVMCDLLGLKPAPNNGTHGSLNHLLPTSSGLVLGGLDDLGCNCDEKVSPEDHLPGEPLSHTHTLVSTNAHEDIIKKLKVSVCPWFSYI
uniref:Ectonucleotide pyrophosphatase/phosphodiesterase 2 n=1 Tax=Neogobius melanostomus TaxID=47308 RepID=A0A8C6SRX6_9GOBI